MIAGICEDDPVYIDAVTSACELWNIHHPAIGLAVKKYAAPEDLLDDWECGAIYDILFLDIEFRFMSGYELAEEIRKKDRKVIIVFITNYNNYAVSGYKLYIHRYLMKPVDNQDIFDCLDYCQSQLLQFSGNYITFSQAGGSPRYHLKDIMLIESRGHSIELTFPGAREAEKIRYYDTFAKLQERLPQNQFIRCNRGTIVNLLYVESFTRTEIKIVGRKEIIPIGAKYKDSVYTSLSSYFWENNL